MQKKQKKEEEKKKMAKKKVTSIFGGPWKRAGSSSTIFFSKKSGFSKFSKKTIFIVLPEKMGGNHFFSKRLCYKDDRLRGENW